MTGLNFRGALGPLADSSELNNAHLITDTTAGFTLSSSQICLLQVISDVLLHTTTTSFSTCQ